MPPLQAPFSGRTWVANGHPLVAPLEPSGTLSLMAGHPKPDYATPQRAGPGPDGIRSWIDLVLVLALCLLVWLLLSR